MTDFPKMDPQIEQLAALAERWQNASHNEAFGMGAGSPTMADAHDAAKHAFIRALHETRPQRIADALALLARYQRRAESASVAIPLP